MHARRWYDKQIAMSGMSYLQQEHSKRIFESLTWYIRALD